MSKKNKPTIIDINEDSLEGIKSRVFSSSLLEEDKKIIVAIVVAYAWLQSQLENTKLTIARLKKLFGFITEKRGNAKSKKSNKSQSSENTDISDPKLPNANDTQNSEQDPPEKK